MGNNDSDDKPPSKKRNAHTVEQRELKRNGSKAQEDNADGGQSEGRSYENIAGLFFRRQQGRAARTGATTPYILRIRLFFCVSGLIRAA